MAVVWTKHGGMSVADPFSGRPSGGGGMTTLEQPTPSVGELRGTSAEAEAQIRAFRLGGQQAFLRERAKAIARIEQARIQADKLRLEELREKSRLEGLRKEKIALTRKQALEQKAQKDKFPTGVQRRTRVREEAITVTPSKRDTIKEKAKRFGVALFTPSIAPEEVKRLPKEERGVAAAKGIFFGGIEGLYQYAKKSEREIHIKVPIHTGILTPIFGKKEPIDLGKVKPSRVVAEFIPRTTAEVLVLRYFPKLPKAVQIPVTGVVTGLGVKGALDVSRTKEERIASGMMGVAAGVGTAVQVIPYARGLKAQTIGRITGKYKPIKVQPGGFKAIQLKETRVGLIPEKAPLKIGITEGVKLPKLSPLRRGAFGVRPSEKALFLGKGQTLATSQRGLFKEGVTIKPTPTAPREFFVSPQDPFAKISITRVSRLGLEKPFAFPKKVQIGFGIPKKPQIGLEYGARVARVERAGAYRIGTGTELEAIKTLPTIKVQKKLGVATIKGQAIEIFKIKTTPTKGVITPKVPTTEGITRVSGEAALVSYEIVPSVPTVPVTPTLTPTALVSAPTPSKVPISVPTMISPPISPPTKPSRRPTIPTRLLPTMISPPISPPTKPSRRPTAIPRLPRKRRREEELLPTYGVAVRRYGKFKPIGAGLSLKQAFAVGRERVAKTLGATFKIIGRPKGLKIPKGFYVKPTKTGTLFIEKRRLRLSTRPEVKEIHVAKRRKRR